MLRVQKLRAVVHSVLSKIRRAGLPSIVSVVLAIFVSAEGARVAYQLVLLARGDSHEQELQNEARPPVLASAHRPSARVIMAAHLFGLPAPPPVSTDPNDVPVSAADMKLTGTLARRNSKRGMAIVTINGKSSFYKVGAPLGGAILAAVYRDRVILDRDGVQEALLIPRTHPQSEPNSPRTEVAAARAAAIEAPTPISITNVIRPGPAVMNESGYARGYRLFPGNDGAAFEAAGLQRGDVMVALNGTSVLEQHGWSGQALFQSMPGTTQATLTIERNGQTHDVVVNLAQAQPWASSSAPPSNDTHDESP
jgi:general secretion pathway protein C